MDALAQSGASAVLLSRPREHPCRFSVAVGDTAFPLWVYIWTLTHGGGARRPTHEYRIQLTAVAPPLPLNPHGPTLLLGYEPAAGCFAGFDMARHRQFSTNSPSLQIDIRAVQDAQRDGLAPCRKENKEIAFWIRPDYLLTYAMSEGIHDDDDRQFAILERVCKLEQLHPDIADLSTERGRIVSTVSRLVRDRDFCRKVSVAYERKCCVTGLQLRLTDAAHILPVDAPGSTDEVSNGLCLSATYHRAFDSGLIFLSDDMVMHLNQARRSELAKMDLIGGLREFELPLGRRISLPADRQQWPIPKLICAANRVRGIRVA